jgi:hypothetical protein
MVVAIREVGNSHLVLSYIIHHTSNVADDFVDGKSSEIIPPHWKSDCLKHKHNQRTQSTLKHVSKLLSKNLKGEEERNRCVIRNNPSGIVAP